MQIILNCDIMCAFYNRLCVFSDLLTFQVCFLVIGNHFHYFCKFQKDKSIVFFQVSFGYYLST